MHEHTVGVVITHTVVWVTGSEPGRYRSGAIVARRAIIRSGILIRMHFLAPGNPYALMTI